MRIAPIVLLGALCLAASASAQEPPPPPELSEPASESDAPAPAAVTEGDAVRLQQDDAARDEKVLPRARTTAPADEAPLPTKVRPSDELPPAVTIRRDGDTTVEEYRRDGRVYMVRVVPDRGLSYTYLDTDGDGRLEGDPKEGPMQPVYYTIYEWE